MGKQLKVSTKALKALQNEKKILDVAGKYPDGAYPKGIALETGINHNTVRSACIRLAGRGILKIDPIHKGMYRLVDNDGHGVFSFNFHNTEIFYKSDKPLVEHQLKVENSLNSLFKYRFIAGVESKKASMRLSTEYPFSISSLGLAVELFQRIMEKELGIKVSDKEVWISCIEFNKDYPNLKLEGVNCITWDEMISQFKLYNKSKGLREEYRIKIPFNYDFMNKLFSNGLATAESMALMERNDKKNDSIIKMINKLNMKVNWLCDNFHKDNKMKVEKSSLF